MPLLSMRPCAFVLGSFVLLLADVARPCSPPLASVSGTAVPDDGNVLPLNGVVHARLDTLGITPTVVLRKDTELIGRTIDVDTAGAVFRMNLTELEPATSYSLHVSIPVDEAGFVEDIELTKRTLHFTTTTRADTTAPTFAGAASIGVEHVPGSDAVDSCGGVLTATNRITITPPAVRDDVGVAGVKLFRKNADGTREMRVFTLNATTALEDSEPSAGDYEYEIVVVDLAGNESEPLEVDVHVDGGALGCSAAGAVPVSPFVAVIALAMLRRTRRARMTS